MVTMKTTTRYIVTLIVFAVILTATTATVIFANRRMARLGEQLRIAQRIQRTAADLSFLSNDYLLYHEDGQRELWETEYDELVALVDGLRPQDATQASLVRSMQRHQGLWLAIFQDVVETIDRTAPSSTLETDFFRVSWSRMEVQNRGILADASRLAELLTDETQRLKQISVILVLLLVATFALYLLLNYTNVYRHILTSIARLHQATRIVGAGKLDYALEPTGTDEIGELIEAFNEMTANLNRTIAEREQAEGALRTALAEKETLLRELYHRTKNNMQVMMAMLEMQSAYIDDEEMVKILKETQSRIQSMAMVHQKLYESKDLSTVNLGDYVRDLADLLMTSYGVPADKVALNVTTDDVFVLIDTAIPCGLVVNEVLTNALTHAFPDGQEGRIDVGVRSDGREQITVTVADNGVGVPEGFDFRTSGNLGTLMVYTIGEQQLQGEVSFEADDGVTFEMRFPTGTYERRV